MLIEAIHFLNIVTLIGCVIQDVIWCKGPIEKLLGWILFFLGSIDRLKLYWEVWYNLWKNCLIIYLDLEGCRICGVMGCSIDPLDRRSQSNVILYISSSILFHHIPFWIQSCLFTYKYLPNIIIMSWSQGRRKVWAYLFLVHATGFGSIWCSLMEGYLILLDDVYHLISRVSLACL